MLINGPCDSLGSLLQLLNWKDICALAEGRILDASELPGGYCEIRRGINQVGMYALRNQKPMYR